KLAHQSARREPAFLPLSIPPSDVPAERLWRASLPAKRVVRPALANQPARHRCPREPLAHPAAFALARPACASDRSWPAAPLVEKELPAARQSGAGFPGLAES